MSPKSSPYPVNFFAHVGLRKHNNTLLGCALLLGQGLPIQSYAAVETRQQPIQIIADSLEVFGNDQRAELRGGVELQQGVQSISAEQLDLLLNRSQFTEQISARGAVTFRRPDLELNAEQISYNLQTQDGMAQQAEFRLPGTAARGSAAQLTLQQGQLGHLSDISYTTCPTNDESWLLSAAEFDFDLTKGLGTASDARLAMFGTPVAWLPRLTFPIDGERHSGLLVPSIGYNQNRGIEIATPYYLNLAPNYDLTLTPRLMSRRGAMLGSELRFLSHTTEGQIEAEFLPQDALSPLYSENRGSLSIRTDSQLNQHLSAFLRFNQVSDEAYLDDFGNSLEITSTSHLQRSAGLRYDTAYWALSGQVQSYQTLDTTLSESERPYDQLPQIAFSLDRSDLAGATRIQFDSEWVRFAKSDNVIEGTRIDLQSHLSLPLQSTFYHLTPSIGARYTAYQLDQQPAPLDNAPERFAPIVSLDSGLYFDRSSNWFGEAITQSLEPRLHYLWVPHRDQTDIPIFDTSEYDFSFDNLFRTNRFNGADRLGDANQMTLAITSRTHHNASGREVLRASLGQVLYFADRKVQLPGSSIAGQTESAWVGELAADWGNGWHSRAGAAWDPSRDQLEQALAEASYRDLKDNIVSLTYRLRDGVAEHTDLSTIWPINANTRMIARWNYSLRDQRNLETVAGVEFGQCCWRLRGLLRQHSDGTLNNQNIGFLIQLELRGLGRLGDNIDTLLDNGIYGYRRDHD